MAWSHTVYYVNKFDIGRTRLMQRKMKNSQITFISPYKNTDGKEKKKQRQLQSFLRYTQTLIQFNNNNNKLIDMHFKYLTNLQN